MLAGNLVPGDGSAQVADLANSPAACAGPSRNQQPDSSLEAAFQVRRNDATLRISLAKKYPALLAFLRGILHRSAPSLP